MRAQVHCRVPERIVNPGKIDLAAVDSLSGVLLQGAVFVITDGQDTVRMTSDVTGIASFYNRFSKDTLTVLTSMMGYRARKDTAVCARQNQYFLTIGLGQEKLELSEIVVTADAIAMVVKGDTTMFNANAFSTKTGDVLQDLLVQLPGISVTEGGVSYNGQKIDRIFFNGNNLFGKDMANAMDMVLANEVKSVEIYDRQAVEDLDDDSVEAKEHIMDVHTWKPLERVGEMVAGGGAAHRDSWGGMLSAANYVADSRTPRLSAVISAGKNGSMSKKYGLSPLSTPLTSYLVNFNAAKDLPQKYGWSHNLDLSFYDSEMESGSYTSYSPTSEWLVKRDTTLSVARDKKGKMNYRFSYYTRRNKTSIRANGTADIVISRDAADDRSISEVDGLRSAYQLCSADTSRQFAFSAGVGIEQSFNVKRRKLSASLKLGGSFRNGRGFRDNCTLPLENITKDIREMNPSWTVKWLEPFGKKSSLDVDVTGSASLNTEKVVFFDALSGITDLNNSKDYNLCCLTNTVRAGYRYGRRNDGFFAEMLLGVRDIWDSRQEMLGNVGNRDKNFIRPVLDAKVSYSNGNSNVSFSYSETEQVPGPAQLRNVVDDNNPLFLVSGNPELKMPVERKADILYGRSFAEMNMSLMLVAKASLFSNAIVSGYKYFSEDTYLPEYGYTAVSGSSLSAPENVSGKFRADLSARLDKYFTSINTEARFFARYSVSNDPFYWVSQLKANFSHSLACSVEISYQSDRVSLFLLPKASLGRTLCGGELVTDFVTVGGDFQFVCRLGEHFDLNIISVVDRLFSTRKETDFGNYSLDAGLSYLFGKDKQSRIVFFVGNVLDDTSGISDEIAANFIRKSFNSYRGRTIGLSFVYVISKR